MKTLKQALYLIGEIIIMYAGILGVISIFFDIHVINHGGVINVESILLKYIGALIGTVLHFAGYNVRKKRMETENRP